MKTLKYFLLILCFKVVFNLNFEGIYDPNDYKQDYHQPIDQENYIRKVKEMSYKCLNLTNIVQKSGKNVSVNSLVLNMTMEQKLEAFQNSDCPPLVILPGFFGSKLEFKMENCAEFQKFHPNIMKSCGWKSCTDKKLQRFLMWVNTDIDFGDIMEVVFGAGKGKKNKKVNADPYIPHFIKHLNIDENIIDYHHKEECFGNLFRIYYTKNESENGEQKYQITNLKGAKIKVVKSDKKECGINAISNFLGDSLSTTRDFQGFAKMDEFLLRLGYTRGLNLFYHPYDFRIPIDNIMRRIDNTVKLAYKITKKKPILIGHSFGGLLSYKYSLQNKSLIKEIVAIGSPFLGNFEGLKNKFITKKIIDLESNFNIFGMDVKIYAELDVNSSTMLHTTYPSLHFMPQYLPEDEVNENLSKINIFEVIIKNNHDTLEVKSELKKLINKDENKFLKYLYSIFPKVYSKCKSISSKNLANSHLSPICKINYKNILNETMLLLHGEEVKIGGDLTLVDFKNKYTKIVKENLKVLNKDVHEIFHLEAESFVNYLFGIKDKELHKFRNPEVPFTFIYSNHIDTPFKMILEKEKYSIETVPGDGTVESYSQIYPGLKWLYEGFTGSFSQPLHFVEYCADYKKKSTSTYDRKQSQYVSISCDCIEQTNLNPKAVCNHSAMLGDTKLISFIGDIVINSQSKVENVEHFHDLFNAKFNKNMVCSHLDMS